MIRRICLLLAAACAVLEAAAAAAPPAVRVVSMPRTAVAGATWRVTVSLRSRAPARLELRGPSTLRATLVPRGSRRLARATLRFPASGRWVATVVTRGRATRLGLVTVDVPRSPLIRDPIAIAAEPSGSLLVAQLREGPLLRIADGRVTTVAEGGPGAFSVTAGPGGTFATGRDGAVYRLEGSTLTSVSVPLDAGSVAADAAGNLYITVYIGWIKRIAPDGTVSIVAGDGTEGFAGDGGPATSARLFHPHAVAIGADGALYVADTENRRIRRIDLATGRITTFGGDVGITVALAAAPDGSIYSADVVRDGVGGGVTRTTPDGVTTRLVSATTANGVAVAPDGTVYVNLWEDKRIQRLDPQTRRLEPVARG